VKRVIVTGGAGFLGSRVAKHFFSKGYEVYGVGHGEIKRTDHAQSFAVWSNSAVTIESLKALRVVPDFIVHAGGGGSVGASLQDPRKDFLRTLDATSSCLEFIRKEAPEALLVYPSSVAVHGQHGQEPIIISDQVSPVSPYGWHKLMAEQLCTVYKNHFNVRTAVIRFFSIYGEGLKKQLLWDASQKLSGDHPSAEFFGTGDEVRDWLHVDDAVRLIEVLCESRNPPTLVNGGTGVGHSTSQVLTLLKESLKSEMEIVFSGKGRTGDPAYYVASPGEEISLGWYPKVDLRSGIQRYAEWYRSQVRS